MGVLFSFFSLSVEKFMGVLFSFLLFSFLFSCLFSCPRAGQKVVVEPELSKLRLGVLGGELAKALGIKYQVVVSRKD